MWETGKSATKRDIMTPLSRLVAYHAALDAHDLSAVEKMLAPDVRYISHSIGDVIGRDDVMTSLRGYFATNPDHQAFDDRLEQRDANTAVSHWNLRATNQTTGIVTERSGVETVTFDDAGLISLIDVRDT
jgi:ketosteroid isomerase-like protein